MIIAIPKCDIDAARLLLGSTTESHVKMRGLVGADLCWHVLAGSGAEVADLKDKDGPFRDDEALAQWEVFPYRHHEYKETNTSPTALANYGRMCVCGNSSTNQVHQLCWAQVPPLPKDE